MDSSINRKGRHMTTTRIYIAACALSLAASTAAIAGEYQNLDATGLAYSRGMKTTCDISEQVEGKTYCFGSESSKAQFMKDPTGHRAKADAYYASKASDPNWKPCRYFSDYPYAKGNGCE
jgi:YHS domain-containing protein